MYYAVCEDHYLTHVPGLVTIHTNLSTSKLGSLALLVLVWIPITSMLCSTLFCCRSSVVNTSTGGACFSVLAPGEVVW